MDFCKIIASQDIKVENGSQVANIFRNTGTIDFTPNHINPNQRRIIQRTMNLFKDSAIRESKSNLLTLGESIQNQKFSPRFAFA